MYPQLACPRSVGDSIVPVGDPGEQLIANVILSGVVCQLNSEASARPFILQAHALALELAGRSPTYRPPHPSKFARLICQIAGETESILYSVIEDILVVPTITLEPILRAQPRETGVLLSLEIVRYQSPLENTEDRGFIGTANEGRCN